MDSPWSRRLIALRISAPRTSARSRRRSARIRQTSGNATRKTSTAIANAVVNMFIASRIATIERRVGILESFAPCAGSQGTGLSARRRREAAFRAVCLSGILVDGRLARIMAAATNEPLAALATHALGFVKAGDVVGLGSGRAAGAFVCALAARVRDRLRVRGVPTSDETERLSRDHAIELVGLEPDTH